jgi:hypothetical protein
VPPIAAVYQLIVFPADVATRFVEAPTHIVEGVADAVGALGGVLIVTVALP